MTAKQDEQMIDALRDWLHGLHLARMELVGEARALRLAGRKAERENVWARVEELTELIEVSNRELSEHMLRDETQRRGDAEARLSCKKTPMLCFAHGGSEGCEQQNREQGTRCPKCSNTGIHRPSEPKANDGSVG